MNFSSKQKSRSLLSALITFGFHGIVLVLLLTLGLDYQVPPPPEMGTEIDMGILEHFGNAMPGTPGGSESIAPETPPAEHTENTVSTLSDEDLPIQQPKKENKPIAKPKNNIAQEETPRINPDALFRKGQVKGQGSGEGSGSGKTTGNGDGGGGGTGNDASGNGTSFSLLGRNAKTLPKPAVATPELGTVVVKIYVNQNGEVVRAVAGERGTTIGNSQVLKLCEDAAKQARFSQNTKAQEVQTGTITYKFTR